MKQNRRKRKREALKVENTISLAIGQTLKPAIDSTKRTSTPLQGKVVAVSTVLDAASEADHKVENSYSAVISLCQKAGAQTTAQVHKKVFCVVATDSAAGYGTQTASQRVRKAWKRNITVARVEWLEKCIQERCLLPFTDEFVLQPSERQIEREELKKQQNFSNVSEKKPIAEADMELEERQLDLGCCCVCHETDDKTCEWCVDCTVNLAARELDK